MPDKTRLNALKRQRRNRRPVARQLKEGYVFTDGGLLKGPQQRMTEGDVVVTVDEQGVARATGRVLADGSIGKYEPRTQP